MRSSHISLKKLAVTQFFALGFLCLIAGGSAAFAGASKAEGAYDFRNINWGMSRAEVLAREKNLPVAEEYKQGSRIVSFASHLYGLRANLSYTFTRDKCWYVKYEVTGIIGSDLENMKQVYQKLERDLFRQYGGSLVSLKLGDDSIMSRTWQTGNADIHLYLQSALGQDDRLELSLSFLCRDLMNEVFETSHSRVYGF